MIPQGVRRGTGGLVCGVLDSPDVNAFALPGGYIYITRGLLAYLNSEAELAGVLGHEIGHVTARHAVRQQSTAQAARAGGGLLSILVPEFGYAGLQQLINLLGTALLRGYGRDQELEADRLGAEYLARGGYDPDAMIWVLRTLKAQEALDLELARLEGRPARAYHGLFATHPDNDTRLREVITAAAQYANARGETCRDRYLDEIDGLTIGANTREGVVRGGRFQHLGLDFSVGVPADWKLENTPSRIVLTEPRGLAQTQVMLVPAGSASSPQAVLEKLGVTEFVQPHTLAPAGLAGISGLTRVNVDGTPCVARLSVLLHHERGFEFLGLTGPEADMRQFDPKFVAFANDFRPLTAAERGKIRNRRLQVVAQSGPVSWAALAKASPLKRLPEQQLRVLNAAATTERMPGPGRIKVVE